MPLLYNFSMRKRVFDDFQKLTEMLNLRRQGLSYLKLAQLFQCDHTTIVYHCKKNGLTLGKRHLFLANRGVFKSEDALREMLLLRLNGWSYPALAAKYLVLHPAIVYHCKKNGVNIGQTLIFKNLQPAQPLEVKHKYEHIIFEPINRGKKAYKQYLQEVTSRRVANLGVDK